MVSPAMLIVALVIAIAIILFCIIGSEFFIQYKLIFRGRKEAHHS